jgi:D-alanyl-D-alanine carboxypeptidase/D-alanyl-D-alanine-endopeptidase (penicillin-binding protein 4)
MKRLFLIFIFVNVFSQNIFATSLEAPINNIINKVDPQINMGLMVVDLSTGETLYQRNPSKLFTPASNMKLFSEAAALLTFGPNYTFKTTISTDATSLKNGVLYGSIFLNLSGDPSLSKKSIKYLFGQLQGWGVKQILGNVIIVSNLSSVKPHAPGVAPKDFSHSYGAPVAPVILDENRVTITVNPAANIGNIAIVETSSFDGVFKVNNNIKTEAQGNCGISAKTTKNNGLKLYGCIHKNSQAIQLLIPISNPLAYTKNLIKQTLNNANIKLDGKVALGKIPSSTFLLAKHVSKPITSLMANTLKRSDNLYADSLFLHAAQNIHGSRLNWQGAEPVIKNFLTQQTGVNFQSAVLIDGSGLSRHDLITPMQTIGLLTYIHTRFPLAYEYIAALPIAGSDGTLIKRFKKPSQKGLLRAKTGSLTGVNSLSGYLYTANGHTLAFAIYINKRPGTHPNVSGRYLGMIDTICSFLLQQKPQNKIITSSINSIRNISFQQKPSYAEQMRSAYAKWRNIEYTLKHNLAAQSASVVFRNNNILIIDNNPSPENIWNIIQNIRKKYSFAVGLKTNQAPLNAKMPILILQDDKSTQNKRTWYLQENVG